MAGFGAKQVVDGPPPKAPRHGLFDHANLVTEGSDRWLNGVEPWFYPSDTPLTFDQCGGGSSGGPKSAGTALVDPAAQDVGAFTVYSPETCTAYRIGDDIDEYRRRATVQMAATEQWAVEREIEQGLRIPANPFFAKVNAVQASGNDTAQTGLAGLAYLERVIANTGRAGIIHAAVEIATRWARDFLIEEDSDGKMYTAAKKTPVVVGSGYQGAPPSGRSANTGTILCAYATGEIDIRRSEMFVMPDDVSQALNRSDNSIVYRAERYYVYDWDAATLRAYVRIDWTT